MILVGENINIISKTYGPAIRDRDAKPIQDLAVKQAEAGIDYLDINIGPARKHGEETMEWVVKTVHEVVDLPLSLDTTNANAIKAGLRVHKGKALVNSVSLQPERIEHLLPAVVEYGASMIGLLWGREGMPRDTDERATFAAELVMVAAEAGVPMEDIWIDPIATPVGVDINQVLSCVEAMSILQEITPGTRSIVGLSNVSNGVPNELRPYLNRTYLAMLMKHGLYSAIVDAFDDELVALAKGKMPEILELVHGMMDGEEPDLSKLSDKEREYAKTTRVLLGKELYSDSWLTN